MSDTRAAKEYMTARQQKWHWGVRYALRRVSRKTRAFVLAAVLGAVTLLVASTVEGSTGACGVCSYELLQREVRPADRGTASWALADLYQLTKMRMKK